MRCVWSKKASSWKNSTLNRTFLQQLAVRVDVVGRFRFDVGIFFNAFN